MEKATVFGLILGIGGILLGNVIEGGQTAALIQGAAAFIVLSGTFGAVLVSHRGRDIAEALQMAKQAFFTPASEVGPLLAQILEFSKAAKKESVLVLETQIEKIDHDFLRDVMRTVVDSVDPQVMRNVFETRMRVREEKLMNAAKVWADAGGYAPTIGIIGAVLGLIQVMANLTDTSKLGSGIAVAFVATIYGVGFANLIFLPLASKIKKVIHERMRVYEMILEGGLGIQASLNPSVLEMKLKAYLPERK